MINSSERANECTSSKDSRCDRFKSESSVSYVIPMIPFIGVLYQHCQHQPRKGVGHNRTTHRISCDMFAKNSDLLRFANSAASRAAVFF